jgi:hypothetical protein
MAYSSAFTLTNNNVITGILLYCMQGTTPSTKTLTVKFSHDGSTDDGSSTINCSALPPNGSPGWVLFNLPSPYTSGGVSTNKIGLQASATTGAIVYGSSTAVTAIGHIIVTSTGAVDHPAATDITYIATDIVAGTARTVTMNNTDTTVFGAVNICSNATLNFPDAAGALQLRTAAKTLIWGNLVMGTVGTPITQGNSAELYWASGTGTGFTTYNGSSLTTYGAAKTQWQRLAADASGSATSIALDSVPTNWANGDLVTLTTTTGTATQSETKALGADVTTTTATIAALSQAHKGTGTYIAYVGNLTRNVKFTSYNAAADLVNTIAAGCVASIKYAEFTNCQYSAFAINCNTATGGSFVLQNCSIHGGSSGAYIFTLSNIGSPGPTVTISNNNMYTTSAVLTTSAPFQQQNFTFDTNLIVVADTSHSVFNFAQYPQTTSTTIGYGVITNNVMVGGGAAMTTICEPFAHYDSNVHLCYVYGLATSSPQHWCGTFDNNYYGNPQSGATAIYTISQICGYFNVTNSTFLGTPAYGQIDCQSVTGEFTNCTFANGGLAPNTSANTHIDLTFNNCTSSAGTFITWPTAYGSGINVYLNKCSWSTLLGNQSSMHHGDSLVVQNANGTAGDNRIYTLYGTVSSDSVIVNAPQTQSQRCTPQAAASGLAVANVPMLKACLESQKYHAFVNIGQNCTFAINVRRSAAGDAGGANYTGDQPQLIVKRNVSAGILADTQIAVMTGSAYGSWINVSGSLSGAGITTTCDAMLDFVVTCTGSTGWINVSDPTFS